MAFYQIIFVASAVLLNVGCLGMLADDTAATRLHDTEAQRFFDSIPEDEKDYFVSYALATEVAKEDDPLSASHMNPSDDYVVKVPDDLDIPPDVLANFETMDIPVGFTSGMYHWVRDEYDMNEHEVTVLAVRSEYCFPDGHCVDLNDVGNTCCPF